MYKFPAPIIIKKQPKYKCVTYCNQLATCNTIFAEYQVNVMVMKPIIGITTFFQASGLQEILNRNFLFKLPYIWSRSSTVSGESCGSAGQTNEQIEDEVIKSKGHTREPISKTFTVTNKSLYPPMIDCFWCISRHQIEPSGFIFLYPGWLLDT